MHSNAFASEKLIFAVDLIRHGDRTSICEIPNSPYFSKEHLGELTQTGINQERQLGSELREQYVYRYHLLPKNYSEPTLYVRSTYAKRTILSAEAFLLGLYPMNSRSVKNQQIPIHSVAASDDNLLLVKPNKNVFSMIHLYLAKRKAWHEEKKALKDQLAYWSKQTGLALNSAQQLDCLGDNLYIRQLHKVPLPQGINNQDAEKIISVTNAVMINELKLKEVNQPMGKAFLRTVSDYLTQATQKKTSLKYVLFSGHDMSIMSVMNILKSPLDEIPDYASHLNFLLLEEDNAYFVKINYNNKSVYIPACGGNICTLPQFTALANSQE